MILCQSLLQELYVSVISPIYPRQKLPSPSRVPFQQLLVLNTEMQRIIWKLNRHVRINTYSLQTGVCDKNYGLLHLNFGKMGLVRTITLNKWKQKRMLSNHWHTMTTEWVNIVSKHCNLINNLIQLVVPNEATKHTILATGGDNSNKRCFGTKPKLLREFGDFSGNRDTWKFFREIRDNSGTLQKKILEFMSGILKISGKVTQKFRRMIQISGTTYVKIQ